MIEFNFFLCHVQCEKGKVNYCTSSYGGGYGGGGGGYGEAVFQLFTNQVLLDKTQVTKGDRTIKDISAILIQRKKNEVNGRIVKYSKTVKYCEMTSGGNQLKSHLCDEGTLMKDISKDRKVFDKKNESPFKNVDAMR